MTKIIVGVAEDAEPGQIDSLRDALEKAGFTSMKFESDISLFHGNYDGSLEDIKTLPNVLYASEEVRLEPATP